MLASPFSVIGTRAQIIDDLRARRERWGLARWLGRSRPLDYAGVARAVAPWQPYAGLVYFHLLLDGLSRSGALESPFASPTAVSI